MNASHSQHQLSAHGLCCMRGDRTLITDLDFSLKSGQLMHLSGHNGSGKTTLLRTLAGLLTAAEGEVRWDDKPIHKVRAEFNNDLLYLGHLNGLKGDLTAVENLRSDASVRGYEFSEQDAWQTLSDVGLRGHEDLPTKYLSQGQKRRVALARLWFSEAALWILDEPFSALDVAAVEQLQTVIRAHLQRGGMVMLTTHQEVTLTSGDVLSLELGKSHV